MNILVALRQERGKLQQQLKGVEGAILALSGPHPGASRAKVASHKGVTRKRIWRAGLRHCLPQVAEHEVDMGKFRLKKQLGRQ